MPFSNIPVEIARWLEQMRKAGEYFNNSHPGVLHVSPRPEVGVEAYAITLFDPQPESNLRQYEQVHSIRIPTSYRDILRTLNGANLFGLSLFGTPISMSQTPPILNRSVEQPLDLATANKHWRSEYRAEEDEFHFGASSWTSAANVGYFIEEEGSVRALRSGGLLRRGQCVGRWHDFSEFLAAEIQRNYDAYPEY